MRKVRGDLKLFRHGGGFGWSWDLHIRVGQGKSVRASHVLSPMRGFECARHLVLAKRAAHREAKRLGIEIVTETIE